MKDLSRLAVDRPVTFLMVTLICIGVGLFGLMNLRLNLYPDLSYPTVTVYTTYEGVAPEEIETLITRPIEEAVGSVSGIQRVRSLSSQGASVVRLHFNWGSDLFFAETEVRKQLDMIRRSLPQDAEQPVVFSYDPNDEPVVVLALTSETRSPRDLRTLSTQQLEQRIERIAGVASATTSGGYDRQVNIRMDHAGMRAYNLDIGQVADRLSQENIQVPAGELREGESTYSIRTVGDFRNVDQIRETIVASVEGNPVYLGDVANVEDGIAQPIGNVRVNGQDGIVVNVYRQSDSNVVAAASGVTESLEEIRRILPDDVELSILTNQADFIEQSIRNLIRTGFQAVFLVVLMLLLFLRNGRSALVVAVSIPVSVITTFSIMHWADVSINIISLSGLTLAVGLVVDNAVVVLENIFRFREDGADGETAAVNGAREVMAPVVMSTLTTLVVFLPVLFVPGIAGLLFRDLALTVSFALVVSVLVALTLIPVLSSRLLSAEASTGDSQGLNRNGRLEAWLDWRSQSLIRRIWTLPFVLLFLLLYPLWWLAFALYKPVGSFLKREVSPRLERGFLRMEKEYRSTVQRLLPVSGRVVGAAFLFLLATVPVFYQLGGEFFPVADEGSIVIEVQREPGVNLFELERTIRQVEDVIREEVPEMRLMVSDYGDKTGIEGADNPGGNRGVVRIELIPVEQRSRHQIQITASLLRSLERVPGAYIRELREDPLSPDGETGLVTFIYGFDPEIRTAMAGQAMNEINRMPGFAGVYTTADEGRPELRIEMDRERISRVGMTTSQVATAVSNAVRGNRATTFVDQGIEFEVLVELDPRERAHSGLLEEMQIQTPEAGWMPLSNLARVERYSGPSAIHRINQERVTEIGADLDDLDLRTASERVRSVMEAMNWPDGYRYEIGGAAEDQQQSFYYLMIAFMIAGILTYMVMASQFESLVEPFIIIVTIPLALSGVLIALWITQTPISVTALVGLVLLTGIVVNNGIVMIDYIKILRARGQDRDRAIADGATRRLRPILMTAFTTILAMVPLALQLGAGAETWSPMARTVIGGLMMSTLLMLFAVPCMYRLVTRLVERSGFEASRRDDPLYEDSSGR